MGRYGLSGEDTSRGLCRVVWFLVIFAHLPAAKEKELLYQRAEEALAKTKGRISLISRWFPILFRTSLVAQWLPREIASPALVGREAAVNAGSQLVKETYKIEMYISSQRSVRCETFPPYKSVISSPRILVGSTSSMPNSGLLDSRERSITRKQRGAFTESVTHDHWSCRFLAGTGR